MIAVLLENVADLLNVLRLSYERSGDEVEFILHGEKDIFLIFCGQGRQAKLRVRNVDALFSRDRTAVADCAVDVAAVDAVNDELDETVVDEDSGTFLDVAGELLVRNGKLLIGTDDILLTDDDLGTLDEIGLSALKLTRSDLRALGVEQKCDRKVELLADTLYAVDTLLVFLVGTVRKVQSRDVHAREHQLTNDLVGIRGRTQGTDYFGFTHTHSLSPYCFATARKALVQGGLDAFSHCFGMET